MSLSSRFNEVLETKSDNPWTLVRKVKVDAQQPGLTILDFYYLRRKSFESLELNIFFWSFHDIEYIA